jgi:hypothetical protein
MIGIACNSRRIQDMADRSVAQFFYQIAGVLFKTSNCFKVNSFSSGISEEDK